MRRVLGVLIALIGVLLIAGALVVRFVVAPQAIKAPIEDGNDPYTATTVATGEASLLNLDDGELIPGVPVRAERTITADVDASTDDVAVWDVEVVTTNEANGAEISTTTDRVAFDRETSEAVSGYDEAVNGESASHEGTISYKFPFDTQQQTYDYFDTTTGQGWPAEFQDTEDIEGLETYRFEQVVEPTKIGEVEVPGALLRQAVPSVTLDQVYATTRQFWVEPETGVIVKGEENTTRTLELPALGVEVPAFDATLTFDEDTINARVDDAEDAKNLIQVAEVTGPLLLGIAGLLLLVIGLLLLFWRRRRPAEAAAGAGGAAGTGAGAAAAAAPTAEDVTAAAETAEVPKVEDVSGAVEGADVPSPEDVSEAVESAEVPTAEDVSEAVESAEPPSAEDVSDAVGATDTTEAPESSDGTGDAPRPQP